VSGVRVQGSGFRFQVSGLRVQVFEKEGAGGVGDRDDALAGDAVGCGEDDRFAEADMRVGRNADLQRARARGLERCRWAVAPAAASGVRAASGIPRDAALFHVRNASTRRRILRDGPEWR